MAVPTSVSIVEHCQTIEAPRIERPKKHNLRDSLGIAVGTLLPGGAGFQDLALFGKRKRAWLHTCLTWPPGLPSHDTVGRVCARLHPQRLQAWVLAWTPAVAPRMPGTLVSLDGTPGHAACARAPARAPCPRLSAWCAEQGGLVVGQRNTDTQAHAMTALPALLQGLALPGWMGTMHAMGCHTAMAEPMRAQGGDDLCACKHNHTKAWAALQAPLPQQSEPPRSWRDADHVFEAFDTAHGRRVRSSVWTMTAVASLPALEQGPGLQAVLAVATIRLAHTQAPVPRDDRFSLARLGRPAAVLAGMLRQPGAMEHK
jgi:hypothetical protein